MKIRKFTGENKAFIIIAAAIILEALTSVFSSYIGENPFAKEYRIENPVRSYLNGGKSYFISDSGNTVLIADSGNNISVVIGSGDENSSFSSADCMAFDGKGNIYILDKCYTQSGSFAYKQRILKFASNGKLKEILYETETLDDNKKQSSNIYDMHIIDNSLYFVYSDETGIFLNKLTDGSTETVKRIDFKNAYNSLSDADFDNNFNISYVQKNGDVYTFWGDKIKQIYKAAENNTVNYFSLISEICYDSSGGLYLCDVGLKQIYRLDKNMDNPEIIVSCDCQSYEFSKMPLYTGITVNDESVSFLSAEYSCDYEKEEETYTYAIICASKNGNTISETNSLEISLPRRIAIIFEYICILLLACVLTYSFITVVRIIRQGKTDKNIALQIAVLITALAVTLGVSYTIFRNCNSRYIDELEKNLINVGYRISESVDEKDLIQINSPDAIDLECYSNVNDAVCKIIDDKNNSDSNMYCVIYKVVNDVVCEIYRDDRQHSVMYPMAGTYKNSIEEKIAENNEYYIDYNFTLSEGTYIYTIIPVYSGSGETIAFVETGTDYGSFSEANKALYSKVLVMAAMSVIIIMLLFSEFIYAFSAVRVKMESIRKKSVCPPEVIRPLSFVFFLIANISTAFLPIYGMRLWNEDFPLNSEIAAAIPLSAEFITAAVSAFVCGFIIQKLGIRVICIIGALCYVTGNLLAAFSGNLWVLILSNAVCGIGSGFLSISFNTWAAVYDDEENQSKGFIHINAAYLAGLNCGTVIGSLLWENIGIKNTFLISAIFGGILILLIIPMVGKIKVQQDVEADESKGGRLKDLLDFSVIRFFVCILTPYLVCTAFLEYFFPILAEQNNLSAMQISMAFLISGLISIYVGASLAERITKKIGTKKAMVLASFIYAMALFYLVINPTILSCYIVIALFAVADSFGLSAQSVYFSSLPAVKRVGQSKALGVNNTVESITSACGSLIFGAALMLGNQKGIFMIAAVFAVLLAVFMIFDRKRKRDSC